MEPHEQSPWSSAKADKRTITLTIPNCCCLAPIFWPDFRIDFIVAPEEIIPIRREGGRPKGIIKEHLTENKISAIPILGELLPSEQK